MAIRLIGLVEQANELGFETVQDALDGGYEIANNNLIKGKE